jgi:hypothetical protein
MHRMQVATAAHAQLNLQAAATAQVASSSLLLFYAFNETAGSSQVLDYSGNGFHAKLGGRSPPIFTGGTVVLDAKQAQYLSIDPRVAPYLTGGGGSFSVTMSVLFKELQVWAPTFDFGVAGEFGLPNTRACSERCVNARLVVVIIVLLCRAHVGVPTPLPRQNVRSDHI